MITGFKVHIRDQDRISLETIGAGKHLAVIKEYYLECVSNYVLLHVFILNILFPFLMYRVMVIIMIAF